jgi:hypothetical protein
MSYKPMGGHMHGYGVYRHKNITIIECCAIFWMAAVRLTCNGYLRFWSVKPAPVCFLRVAARMFK